jgi:ATP/maltotriose-dependent transcriptional regulator MalT
MWQTVGVGSAALAPLSRVETAELIAGINGEPAAASTVDRVYDRSGGNAFFVEELLQAESAGTLSLERSMRDLLLSRVEQLPEAAQRAVRAVAVGGRKVSHRLLAVAAGMPDETLLSGLRGAVNSHVLVVDGEAYVFRHALAWEAVLGNLLPGESIRLHRAYAAALEEHAELVTPDRLATELAYHWEQAAEPTKALPALLRAASAAEALHAYAEQHRMLARALDLWPLAGGSEVQQVDVLADASRAALRAGEQRAALDLVDEAIAQAAAGEASDNAESAAQLHAQRAWVLLMLGREAALPAAEEAERLVRKGDGAARARVLEILAKAHIQEGRTEQARDVCQEGVRLARELGDGQLRVSVGTTLALTSSNLGLHDEALAELADLRAFAASRQDLPGLTRVYLNLIAELWDVGRYDEAAEAYIAGAKAAEESGLSRTLGAHMTAFTALSLFALGRWPAADARLGEALERDPPGLFAVLPHLVRGEIAIARGDVVAAKAHLAAARGPRRDDHDLRDGGSPMARLIALIALAENRVDDAREGIFAALKALPTRGGTTYSWLLLNTATRVEARARAVGGVAGQLAADHERGEMLRAIATGLLRTTAPRRALAAQFAAEMASLEESNNTAWSDVVSAWDKIGDPYRGCYARLRAAEAALAHADRPTARTLLHHAARQTSALGAIPLLQEIEALARGARLQLSADLPAPVEPTPAERVGLTPREAEVLRLITEGRSNRQIAGELVISVKTASVHVSRILSKLGVASRGEAAAAAYRLQLFDHPHRP